MYINAQKKIKEFKSLTRGQTKNTEENHKSCCYLYYSPTAHPRNSQETSVFTAKIITIGFFEHLESKSKIMLTSRRFETTCQIKIILEIDLGFSNNCWAMLYTHKVVSNRVFIHKLM